MVISLGLIQLQSSSAPRQFAKRIYFCSQWLLELFKRMDWLPAMDYDDNLEMFCNNFTNNQIGFDNIVRTIDSST